MTEQERFEKYARGEYDEPGTVAVNPLERAPEDIIREHQESTPLEPSIPTQRPLTAGEQVRAEKFVRVTQRRVFQVEKELKKLLGNVASSNYYYTKGQALDILDHLRNLINDYESDFLKRGK